MNVNVEMLVVPYDSGHENVRMGRGPQRFLEFGLAERLRDSGHEARVRSLRSEAPFRTEVTTAYELNRQLAAAVRVAAAAGRIPLVLAGNCNSALGTLAGIATTDVGVLWFDAHGDFHTPETTQSGFFDGMALAAVTGRCWRTLSAAIPGYAPLADENVVLVGARAMEAEESDAVRASRLHHITVDAVRREGARACAEAAFDAMAARVRRMYVHMDLDVLDPSEAVANGYAEPEGLRVDEMAAVLDAARARFEMAAVTLAAYDPGCDANGAAVAAGTRFVTQLLAPNPV